MRYGGIDEGRKSCSLCKEYYYLDCLGCPIRSYTGLCFCKNTPYEKWVEHQKYYHGNSIYKSCCTICDKIIEEEIEFLKKVKQYINDKRRVLKND